jgi:hypothetical protein
VDPNLRARLKAARAAGLAPPDLIRKAEPGAVFAVTDDAVDFPAQRIEGTGARKPHETRRVIILQARRLCIASSIKTIVIVPCSASHQGDVGDWDLELPHGEDGFDAPRVVAYVSLAQPVLKSDLRKHEGQISADTLIRLQQVLALNTAIVGSAMDDVRGPPRATRGSPDNSK